ncbi:MAG TPA: DUF1992 domain-containing protein [Roseiflexaceae bacterium]|nr:DUF1992 domain-containing protein [Roseiflexaceae bacterium]
MSNDDHPLRKARDYKNYDDLIDKLVNQAREEGHFDDLAGAGKRLRTDDDVNVPPEDRLAHRMLKSHGFAPPWMEAMRDINTERARIEEWLTRTNARWGKMLEANRASARREYRAMLTDLQRMVMNYNLSAPAAAGQVDGLNMNVELARLGGGETPESAG